MRCLRALSDPDQPAQLARRGAAAAARQLLHHPPQGGAAVEQCLGVRAQRDARRCSLSGVEIADRKGRTSACRGRKMALRMEEIGRVGGVVAIEKRGIMQRLLATRQTEGRRFTAREPFQG